MSGGEFCGNALLSAAVYCTYKGLSSETEFLIETSRSEKSLICNVMEKSFNLFETLAEMPNPLSNKHITIYVKEKKIQGESIQFDGIIHFITGFGRV